MAQRRARDRLPELADAAVRCFRRNGFRATQMSDIAREMGVSEAALYRYVEGKEGLFGLVIRQALFLEDIPDTALPLASPPLELTLRQVSERLSRGAVPPALDRALRRRRADDPRAELDGIVRELYSLVGLTRPAMDMIERSARELPELADLVNHDLRGPLLRALTRYLDRRAAAGQLRRTPHSAATARLLLEVVTWFGRHRFTDPEGAAIPAQAAEDTVADALLHMLLANREAAPSDPQPPGDRQPPPAGPGAPR
jgi:AcrR family transcriptional regulator